jgi:hypothetical protein
MINDLYNVHNSMAKRSEIVEAMLGFVLGIPAIFFGSWLLTGGCHLIGSDTPPTNTCLTGSNFLSLVGFFLASMGALAIVVSLGDLRRRKHAPSSM